MTFRFLRILKFVGQTTGSVAEYRVERSIFSLTSDCRVADTVCRGIHSRDHSEKQHMRNVSNSPDAIPGKRFSIATSISGGPSGWLRPDRIGSSRLEPKVVPGCNTKSRFNGAFFPLTAASPAHNLRLRYPQNQKIQPNEQLERSRTHLIPRRAANSDSRCMRTAGKVQR